MPEVIVENVHKSFGALEVLKGVSLTVGENIMLAPRIVKDVAKSETKDIAREVLQLVGLSEKFDSYPDQLSGGQQQRVAIARSLCMNP